MIDRYARPRMKRVWSDKNKYDNWLLVELAVCEAWADEGVIPQEDLAKLRNARYDLDRLNEIFERTKHDVTAFLESVTEKLGPEGRWLHLGITSSDVWDTATSLQLVAATDLLDEEVEKLMDAIKAQAIGHKDTIMMGRTHGIHAEPITFGLKLVVWWEEMRRNRQRLAQARDAIAVGQISGPVGTHATVPPSVEERVCRRLGLETALASSQILQRDRHAQFVTTLAIIAASLEKFATEVRGLLRTEIREVEEPFTEGKTGSSSMPHKRNPDLTERITGLARLIRGHSVTALENVALWGERDISHSSNERIVLPDASMALDYMLDLFAYVVRDMRIYPERMQSNMESQGGVVFSSRVLLALVEKGMAREDAYKIVQANSTKTWEDGSDFRDLVRADMQVAELLAPDELEELFDYHYFVRHVDETFRRVGFI